MDTNGDQFDQFVDNTIILHPDKKVTPRLHNVQNHLLLDAKDGRESFLRMYQRSTLYYTGRQEFARKQILVNNRFR